MSVFIFIIVIVGLVTFGEVASKWLEAGAARPTLEPGREDEVEQLREQVALLADRVDRLTEEQRFMTRLLEASSGSQALPSDTESRSDQLPDPRTQDPS
ncbi:MAG: hypothetical protein MJB57_07330 [Gemmatimonadetes bacterium]|nr:hypothetical protein [Gemmatimonadota bacterium]